MRIAIDAMGGDNAPRQIVEGVAEAVRNGGADATYLLVGDSDRVGAELDRAGLSGEARVDVLHAPQTIEMHEPLSSLKAKPDSSIGLAVGAVKEKEADALVACGNTGAAVAATQLTWRLLPGVKRAGIAVPIPSSREATVVIDMGGTPTIEHTEVDKSTKTADMLSADIKIENEVARAYDQAATEADDLKLKKLLLLHCEH